MSDVTTLAHTAREQLGAALNALQGPGVPPSMMASAEPVAKAMNLLHQVESAPGNVAALAPEALQAVRQALAGLQAAGGANVSVEQATEAVAGSLGAVHSLSQLGSARAPVRDLAHTAPLNPPQGAAPVASRSPAPGVGQTAPLDAGRAAQPVHPTAPTAAAPAPYGAPPAAAQPAAYSAATAAAPAQYGAPPAAQPIAQAAVAAAAPYGAPPAAQPVAQAAVAAAAPYGAPPAAAAAPYGAPPAAQPMAQVAATAAATANGSLAVEAALGAHSTTNFYKGLSGNDVIDCGGIFVATYNIPAIGQLLQLKISMPGGYEFDAQGVVRWCRDAPQTASMIPDAPPGFGAQFTEISQEARQLVYRYVRIREPLFHDDL